MSKVKGVVNGYRIRRFTRHDRKGIFIIYLRDGEPFTRSKYYNLEEDQIERIKDKLKDYTSTNKKAEELCQTIPLTTIIHFVEEIVYE